MRDRIEAWREAFDTDDNAVVPTLVTYAWNLAAFQTVAKAVELAPEDDDGKKQLNGMVLQLLSGGYWGSAVMAIRRLVDAGPLKGQRGVASLRSILNDVRAHRDRLTRRVYLGDIAGLPYDLDGYSDQDLTPSHQRHNEFDFLSGVQPDQRAEGDLIDVSILDRLDGRLQRLDAIADHATIHFAHAGTQESRQGRDMGPWGLADATNALRELVEVAELIGRWFVFSSVYDVLPTPQDDPFEYLDQPWVSRENYAALRQAWDAFADQTAQWHSIDNDAL